MLCSGCGRPGEPLAEESACQEEVNELGIPVSRYDVVEGIVSQGDSFAKILGRYGVSGAASNRLSSLADTLFDTRKVVLGDHYEAYLSKDGDSTLCWWVYTVDRTRKVIFGLEGGDTVFVNRKDIVKRDMMAEVTISSSLWYDTDKAGVPTEVALRLADIYAWTIDFFGLRPGDSYKALYQVDECDGEVIGVSGLQYAVFTHAGKSYESIFFEQKDSQNTNRYWDAEGKNTRKAFLKAPLKFTRISSGFTYSRRHPVTRKVQPHTGVDYAAPMGTPVVAIGDGTVIEKGYKGAGGNTVRIKHNSTYTTAYLHLSKYGAGIKVGSKVQQGQVIGYVGSTGRSTGPHLDFRIWRNGTPVNPLTMESPSADPLAESNMAEFTALRDSLRIRIERFDGENAYRRRYLAPLGIVAG